MELPILYEDADVVAVDKPAGILTHAALHASKGGQESSTAEEWFRIHYPAVALERAYVHRLDRETSGVLVFAKSQTAYDFLRKAFTDREVYKEYLAIVYGVPKERRGVIDFDIGRSRKDFRLRSAQPKARGTLRAALTRYEVIGEDATHQHALLKLMPETGRTHQLRVHLKAIHHPILGDTLYAGKFLDTGSLGLERLALHARALDLPLPSGGRTTIEAPLPQDLTKAFAHLSSQEYRSRGT